MNVVEKKIDAVLRVSDSDSDAYDKKEQCFLDALEAYIK
jgi:hypothetical protein